MRILFIAAGLAALISAPVTAASLPQSGRLDFDVFRKGKDIGDYSFQFQGTAGSFTVRVETDIKVKVPLLGIAAYRFEQSSVETWSGGHLTALRSTTNDDGEDHSLNIGASNLLPASLWDIDIIGQSTLLNTIDGKAMSVQTTDLGTETVASGHGNVAARHYRISGGLARDLWFDEAGNLARVEFSADDGSTITYVRR